MRYAGAATGQLGAIASQPRPAEQNIAQWIDRELLEKFNAEGTDAHRLCTIRDGWVERFGREILISFKTISARDRLILELYFWRTSLGVEVSRVFGRFLPKKNEEREKPQLLFGDGDQNLQTIATEGFLKYQIDFSEDETTEQLRDKLASFYAKRSLTQTPIEPDDQAEAIFLLLSERLSKTAGHVIPVDGGLQDGFLR